MIVSWLGAASKYNINMLFIVQETKLVKPLRLESCAFFIFSFLIFKTYKVIRRPLGGSKLQTWLVALKPLREKPAPSTVFYFILLWQRLRTTKFEKLKRRSFNSVSVWPRWFDISFFEVWDSNFRQEFYKRN